MLRKARESKGFTLDMIHEATKIPLDILRAIEEGYRVGTLSPFYLRGFVKIYAQFLDLDTETVLRDMSFHTSQDPVNYMVLKQPNKLAKSDKRKSVPPVRVTKNKAAASRPPSGQKASQAASTDKGRVASNAVADNSRKAAEAASAKLRQSLSDFQRWLTPDRRQRLLKVFGVIFLIFMSFKILGFIGSKIANRKPSKPKVTATKAAKADPASESAQASSAPAQPPAAAPASAPANAATSSQADVPAASKPVASKPVSLTVRAKKDTWMQVRTDGAIVFQSIMTKGVTETWYANEEIELSGKNIANIEFEVNGKHIGTLGRSDSKAKRVVVSRKGMNVEK